MQKALDRFNKGKKLFINKKYKDALKEFYAIELDILSSFDESLVHHFRALCHSHLMQLKKSEREFKLALKHRPNYSKIHLDMGKNYYFFYEKNRILEWALGVIKKKNKLEKALKCFEDGLLVEPQDADLWYYRGYILELCGNEIEAKKSFKKSINYNEDIENYEKSKLFVTIHKKRASNSKQLPNHI